MDFTTALKKRRMIRAFSTEPVDPELLETLLEDSLRAPSAGNTAAVEFLILQGREQTQRYWDITLVGSKRTKFRWQQLLDAPVLVLVVTRPSAYPERYGEPDKARESLSASTDQWSVPFWFVDAGCVIQNLLLAVTNASLGACLFGLFDYESAVTREFGIPDQFKPVATIAIGHPLPDEPGRSAKRPRRPLAEVLHHQDW